MTLSDLKHSSSRVVDDLRIRTHRSHSTVAGITLKALAAAHAAAESAAAELFTADNQAHAKQQQTLAEAAAKLQKAKMQPEKCNDLVGEIITVHRAKGAAFNKL
ncbi:TPA: hypothetical protein ACH3X1_015366 [Trebouxia sp. C0004]